MNIEELKKGNPVIEDIAACREVFWNNPDCACKGCACGGSGQVEQPAGQADQPSSQADQKLVDIDEAEARLIRFAPFIEKVYPEVLDGIIESDLTEIPDMKEALAADTGGVLDPVRIQGRLFLKCDSHLPISGSVKARGGIYEVLKFAEKVAMDNGMLSKEDDYSILAEPRFRELFGRYSVAVGSTGNLGLSIGIMSAKLGFQVTVHMSADARQWKKDMLRSKGVIVKEYPDDYEAAVAQGRREAEADPNCHFVDDENSLDLFAGYSVAGKRLKQQLEARGVTIDEEHRLYVYLPCGVGGAPGGVTYGIKEYFGDNAYCYFAEPTHAPCMMLGLASGLHNRISVKDIGIDGITEADGLAVGRASALVADAMQTRLCGCFTVNDSRLYPILAMLEDTEDLFIEPSACAGFEGLKHICGGEADCPAPDENSIHIVWATGGNMVPENERESYYIKGCKALEAAE